MKKNKIMKKSLVNLLFLAFYIVSTAQVDRSMPSSEPAPQINFEEPISYELKNGLKVMFIENHKLPRASVNLLIDNPPITEGKLSGIGYLTGGIMGKGNTFQDKDSFNEEVDFMGSRMSFSSSGGSAFSLSRYFDRVLTMFSQGVLYPNFTKEEFDQEKNILLDNIKNNQKNTPSIARRVEDVLAYGINHPYGEFTTEESMNLIKLSDVTKFYDDYFKPNNAYLVIIGDINVDKTKKLIKKLFGKWENDKNLNMKFSKGSVNEIKEPAGNNEISINVIDMPNSANSEITFQNLVDLKKSDDDYYSVLIANKIFGGGAESRLFNNIREDKGYAYGAYSGIGDDKYSKAKFRATTSTRSQVTDSALVEILKEVQKIHTIPVSKTELKNAKAKYLGEFVLAMERPSTIANYAINIEMNNLNTDYYKNFLSNINKVTTKDVQKAANKYFKLNNAQIVVTGKGSEIIEKLENIKFNDKKIIVKYYDKEGSITQKPSTIEIPEGITANSILKKYISAIGGKEKLKSIKSISLKYQGEAMGSQIISEEIRTEKKTANSTSMNGNVMMKMVINDQEAFVKQGPNKMALPENFHNDIKNSLGVFPELNFLENSKIKFSGVEDIDGIKAYALEINGEMVSVKLLFDINTGLKIREISTTNMGGQTQVQESILGKYLDYSGILLPTEKSQSLGPQSINMSLIDVILNAEFREEDFN